MSDPGSEYRDACRKTDKAFADWKRSADAGVVVFGAMAIGMGVLLIGLISRVAFP